MQPHALSIVEPNGINDTLPELDEFATFVLGDAWDMDQISDTALYRSVDSAFSRVEYINGWFSGTLQYGDGRERIPLLYAGALNNEAMRIGKIGYTYPINADYYRYLSFRLYTNVTGCYSGLVKWHASDERLNPADTGVSNPFFPVPANCAPGWNVYTVDLKTIGIQPAQGSKNWNGIIRELQLIPIGGSGLDGKQIRLDWARLTAADPRTSRPYTIQWSGGSGALTLYASPNDKILDANDILIAQGVNGASGSFTWQTGVLPPGDYYIYLTNGSAGAWSAGPLTINTPPVLTITRPSMTSGQDYATNVIENPWDMSDAADLDLNPPPPFKTWLDQTRFSNGIFSARTLCCPSDLSFSDPIFFLGGMNPNPPGLPDPEVDTSRYHYFSFRFYQEGEQDIPGGWTARIYWWKMNAADNGVVEAPTTGRAILLYEGWNTYKVDLWADDARDPSDTTNPIWINAHPNRLRLDPNELLPHLTPGYVHLDWIKLTATDSVRQGEHFSIQYVSNKGGLTISAYYDTDTNPANGRQAVQTPPAPPPPPPTLTHKIYLPLVKNNADAQGGAIRWDTLAVAPGTYWICLEASDGYNTTIWYSEAPVIVSATNLTATSSDE